MFRMGGWGRPAQDERIGFPADTRPPTYRLRRTVFLQVAVQVRLCRAR